MLILAQNVQNVKKNSHFSTFLKFLKINSHFRIFLFRSEISYFSQFPHI